MANAYIKSLKTGSLETISCSHDVGTKEYGEFFYRVKLDTDNLNMDSSNTARPWVCYKQGQSAPTRCPNCGNGGPFS